MTSAAASIRGNSFWLALARLSAHALGVLFIAFAARRLGAADFGQFSFIAAVLLVGNAFTTFGSDTLLIRELARAGKATDLLPRAFALQLAFSSLWVIVTIILEPGSPLLLYSLSLFPLALSSIASAAMRGFERMDLFWLAGLVNSLAQLIAVVLSWDLLSLCVFLTIGYLAAALVSLAICSASFPTFSLLPLLDFRPIFSLALPFALLATMSILSQRLGIFSVATLIGEREAGYFSAAARVVEGLKLGHYAVLGALLPAMSRAAQGAMRNFRVSFPGLLGFSALLAGAVTLTARPIVNLLYGADYAPSIELLTVLAWTLAPYTVSAFLSVDLVARGREGTLVKATAISLGVFLVLYLWLISTHQLTGAVHAALTGEIIQAVILVIATTNDQRLTTSD